MSKRSRAARPPLEDDGESSDAPLVEHSRKKKKLDPLQVCSAIYEVIRNNKKEDGTLLCDSFIRMPKKRQDPAYYEVVSNPIDLQRIQQRIKTDEYEEVDDMTSDMTLLVKNAKQFYKKNTQEYKDAVELYELYRTTRAKLTESETDSRSSVESEKKDKIILKVGKLKRKAAAAEARKIDPDLDETSESSCNLEDDNSNQIESLFTAVMQAADSENRLLNQAFMLLPTKKKYPDYYDVIEQPIDLKAIARKIQAGKYNAINDLEKDLLLCMKNACSYNEPGSQIYKDAKALKKIIVCRKNDIVQGKFKTPKGRKRGRTQTQKLSAVAAALEDDSGAMDESDREEEDVADPMPEDPDNPLWQLYDLVKNTTNEDGYVLSEPFWKLPSKRYYSDYYHEIRNPVSFMQIRIKLAKGNYGTVSEVAGDLNVMFENAKKYNRPESRLYKDAVKLQKVMQARVKELLEFDHESDSDSDSDSPIVKKEFAAKKPKGGKGGFIRGKYKDNLPLRRRMLSICKALTDYTYEDSRMPILMFMEKPSRKLYPEYYKVISDPIDLLQIQANIKAEKYTNEDQLVADIKAMFSNCRRFNEENSVIYKDATTLEQVLNDKLKEMNSVAEKKNTVKVYKPPRRKLPVDMKLRALYESVRDYKDAKDRRLSEVFLKLPSRADYPDYYEIIKRPMDMEKIRIKLQQSHYDSLDDLAADFMLMLDNASKFNEPDSDIYKSALQLQRVVLKTKRQLIEDGSHVPDAQGAVQELLTSLFSSVYNHQDEEGRCFSDSLQELPEHDEVDGKKVRGISLDIIKRRLDRGLYKRLDRFQEDVFACLDRARRLSRTDSQVFEDSIEIQAFFIRHRDELCRNGEVLSSPALNYNLLHLSAAVEQQKQQKLLKESPEEETETKPPESEPEKAPTPTPSGTPMVQEGSKEQYHIGDFVYMQPRERNAEPNIIHIQRGWTNSDGVQMLYGDYFYRPNETFHVQTRRFLEKEVFKSDQSLAVPLDEVIGRCCVMNVKDYFKSRPIGFKSDDVYVCESRYSTRTRSFKKIKVFTFNLDRITLEPREESFEPKRVMSVFRDRLEKHINEIAELEEHEKMEEKKFPNIELMNMPPHPDISVYHQQLTTSWGVIKTGDFVYVQMEAGKMVCQLDTIWANKEGQYFVKGPFFLRAHEIPYMPGRLFYKEEVFLGAMEEVHPIGNVMGRCYVSDHSEFVSCRPTEIPEKDIYVCQFMYEEQQRQLSKLTSPLKRYTHSDTVLQDEVYYFRRLINPLRIPSETLQLSQPPDVGVKSPPPTLELPPDSLLVPKAEQDLLSLLEDSMDGGPPSVGSGDLPAASPIPSSTPLSKALKDQIQKSKGKDTKVKDKIITGYILYSGEVRKNITVSHPDATFGEISRMVGNEWRQLTTEQKAAWEEKAAKMTQDLKEQAILDELAAAHAAPIPNPPNLPPNWVFECLWDGCDYQFEDLSDCVDHVCAETAGHVASYFSNLPPNKEVEYQCQWRPCNRLKKNSPPFPNIARLLRHVKELHLLKPNGNGKAIGPHERTKNFIPSRRPKTHAPPNANGLQLPAGQQYSTTPQMNARPAEPLFVTVPPRTQRILHSDAYIKYMEGLSSESRYMSNWDRMLRTAHTGPPAVVIDESRLPAHWLANGPGNYGSVSNALWALRDFMLRDAFSLSKVV